MNGKGSPVACLRFVGHVRDACQENETDMTNQKGRLLAIDTGSTSTKIGYFVDGELAFEENLAHKAEDLAGFKDVMEQDTLRRDDVRIFMRGKGIHAQDIDIVMARGGLFYPVVTGIYSVNEDMREVLRSCKYGRHACNLSAIIADDLAKEITEKNVARGVEMPFGVCRAYIADRRWRMRCCRSAVWEVCRNSSADRSFMRSTQGLSSGAI